MSYLGRDIGPSPGINREHFHFCPARTVLVDAVTSGGLFKFLNAMRQVQRRKKLIWRHVFYSLNDSWGFIQSGHWVTSAGWVSPTEWDRKLSAIHQLFPNSRYATWQQNHPQPDPFPPPHFISPSPMLSQHVGTLVNQIEPFSLLHVFFLSGIPSIGILPCQRQEALCVSKHCLLVGHAKAHSCWRQAIKELRKVHHLLPQLRESQRGYGYLDIDTKKGREFGLAFF